MTSGAQWWVRLGRRRGVTVLASGAIALVLTAGVGLVREPLPRIHDEFSYLLAADTFAHGRLANPTHPLWVHFETFHVIQQPTYASKYPPLQGLFLAFGTVVTGHPIAGAWLATALAVAACCWMFQGWLPARWAVVGAAVVALHHGLVFYWAQTYWGAAVPMLGGALVYGAWVRLRRAPRARDALALGLGVAVLANSRPFDGVVACAPVAVALPVAWLRQRRVSLSASFTRVVLPVAALLLAVAAAMAHYNERVTGDPFRLPYQVHEETYSDTPLFVWQPPRPEPEYRHDAIRDFYRGWVRSWYQRRQSLWGSLGQWPRLLSFYYTPVLALPLVAFPWIFGASRMRFALLCCALALAATLALPWEPREHYLAAVAPLLLLLPVQGMRHLAVWRRGLRPSGRALVAGLLAVHAIVFAAAAVRYPQVDPPAWVVERAAVRARLEAEPGQHVVLVEYSDTHSVHEEWVANAADIDAAKVVWARPMGADGIRSLRAHFPDHRFWVIEADQRPAVLRALDPPASPQSLD